MPARQYEFEPQTDDPRIYARHHWEDMRTELNITRDALESSESQSLAQSALIDMLRKELAEAKRAHDVDNVALTIMRTKLKAAGMLVLDALKEDMPPVQTAPPKRLQDVPARSVPQPVPDEPEEVVPLRLSYKWP